MQQLHNQVEEHEAATWTLATDLQQLRDELRDEGDEVVSDLRNARDNLKQVLHERDMLHKRLIEFKLSQQLLAESQDAWYPVIMPWTLMVKRQREALATGLQSGQYAASPKKDHMASKSSKTGTPRSTGP